MSQKIKTSVEIDGSLTASQIANATIDTDKFLVSDAGTIKYRTGAEMLSDLGIVTGTANHVQHQVKAGVAINKGQAVYVTSADGTNMIVGLASNASEATSSKTIGLLNATVAVNGFADVITEGLLSGLDTSTATIGNPVWLGTNGNLIYGLANKPSAPSHLVFIGIVTRVNANNGEIFVKVQNGFELDELHNVDLITTAPSGNDILAYEGNPVNLWKNKSIAAVLGYTPYNASNPAGYISSYTETDPTVPSYVKSITSTEKSNWNTAFGWGNHASAGYALSGHTHGLGRYSLRAPALIDSVTSSNFRTQLFGSSTSGYNISTARFNATPGLLSGLNNYGTMMAWSGYDSHGFLAIDYAGPAAIIGGGDADNINWTKRLAFLDDTVPNNRTITINGTSYDLSANRSWTVTAVEADTLATVTARGNTTTTSITAASVIIPSFETAANVLSFRSGIPDGTNVGIRAKAISTANRDGLELLGYNGIDFSTNNGSTLAMRVLSDGKVAVGATSSGEKFNVTDGGTTSLLRLNQTAATWSSTMVYGTTTATAGGFDFIGMYANGSAKFNVGSTGTASASSDFRAPIFYDSNNTGYYVDPNSTSNIYSANVNGNLQVWGVGGNYNEGIRLVSGTGSWSNIQFGTNSSGAGTQTNQWIVGKKPDGNFVLSLAGNQETSSRFLIRQNGNVEATIYYDGNNTGYYLIPSAAYATSLKIAGNIEMGLGQNYSSIYMGDSDHGTREIHCNSNRVGFLTQGGGWGSWCEDNGDFYSTGTSIGIGAMQAPIFYDYNNTGYYVDPASTSSVNIMSTSETYLGNSSAYSFGTSKWAGTGGYPGYSYTGGNHRFGFSSTGGYIDVYTDGYFYCGIDPTGGNRRVLNEDEWIGNKHFGSGGAIYGTTFYDTNNSGYYVDPASTSTLNAANIGILTFRGVGGDSGVGSIGDMYGIYQQGGAWNYPFPDLCIGYHTGIKIGAYYSYNGTRFYNNSDWATITASVNDGDNNFRGYYDVIAYASDRRLKHKVKPIEDALSKVKSLTGMTYQWNEIGKDHGWDPDTEVREAGVFAQDVQAVLPEAVRLAPFDDEHGVSRSGENFLTVKYDKIVPLLIEAIKEQQTQIEELKELINQLIKK